MPCDQNFEADMAARAIAKEAQPTGRRGCVNELWQTAYDHHILGMISSPASAHLYNAAKAA